MLKGFSFLLLVFSSAALRAQPVERQNVVAVVKKIRGDLWLRAHEERTPLNVGSLLKVGDSIESGEDSRALIEFIATKNTIVLGAKTLFRIEEYTRDSKKSDSLLLSLERGEFRHNVRTKYKNTPANHYKVKTQNAVVGVRGTVFYVSYDPAHSRSEIATQKGLVRGNNKDIPKGRFILVEASLTHDSRDIGLDLLSRLRDLEAFEQEAMEPEQKRDPQTLEVPAN